MSKFAERMIPEEEINKTAPESGDLNSKNPLAENQYENSRKIIKELRLIAQEVSKTINAINLTIQETGAKEKRVFLKNTKGADIADDDLTEEEWETINAYDNERIDWEHGIGVFREDIEYDSRELRSLIESVKALYREFKLPQIIDDYHNENAGKYQPTINEMNDNLEWIRKEDEKKYKPFVEKLEKFLKFQINLERKLEQIVYGEESASLPKEFTESLPREIAEIKPENLPINAPLYMPVGISKELPEWKKVFEYDKKAAKPIDLYGYLFWLENQNRPAELIVCDEIQAANYALLYPNDQEENSSRTMQDATISPKGNKPDATMVRDSSSDFRDLARKIGEREKENYQKIIDAFGLKNIKIIDYREFVKRNEGKFEKCRGLCERLAKNPIFAGGFLSMIQESVSQSMAREEKEKFLPYAVEEVSWILATEGSKVSHINEARYDVLAAVIKNIEKYATDHNIDIFDPRNEEKLPSIINGVLNKLKDRFSAVKSASKNDPDIFEYYEKAEQILKKIRLTAGAGIPADFSKKYADYPFAVPRTGSQSFGWRSGGEKQEAVIKFREPYSTYFYKNGSELFLESDQVVSAEGLIAGKILTMPAEVQQEYAERTIKPILIHYFKTLENAPKEYFKKAEKSREELLAECQESQTLIDLLKFIQKYIVKSSS